MSIAELYYNPSAVGVAARFAALGAIVSFVVAIGWLIFGFVTKKSGTRIRLSSLFWIIAGTSVVLFSLAYVGAGIEAERHQEQIQKRNREFREQNPLPEKTP